jgi:AcrR family transcriptional regulator
MNPKVTSEEEILQTCREIVSKEGTDALNMRHIAEVQGIALGSLYHYFPSKDAMITASVESVWQDIFHLREETKKVLPFDEYVKWIYACVKQSRIDYPNFSMSHSLSFASSAKKEARETMMRCFDQIKNGLSNSLEHDSNVLPSAFSRTFTKNDFIEFVFSSFFVSMIQGKDNCRTVIQVIDRCIYQK